MCIYVNYSYVLNEKDLKEACFQAVYTLDHFKKRRLLISLVYPLLMYLVLLRSDSFVITTFFYVVLVIFFYFYYYQYTLYKTKKRDLNIAKEWQNSFSVEAAEEYLSILYNGVEQKISWGEIVVFTETKDNIILYLSPRTLNFIIFKKRSSFSRKRTPKILFFYKKEIKQKKLMLFLITNKEIEWLLFTATTLFIYYQVHCVLVECKKSFS